MLSRKVKGADVAACCEVHMSNLLACVLIDSAFSCFFSEACTTKMLIKIVSSTLTIKKLGVGKTFKCF